MISDFKPVLKNSAVAGIGNILGKHAYITLSLWNLLLSAIIEVPVVLLRAQQRIFLFTGISIARLVSSLSLNILFIVYFGWKIWGLLYSISVRRVVRSRGVRLAARPERLRRPRRRALALSASKRQVAAPSRAKGSIDAAPV